MKIQNDEILIGNRKIGRRHRCFIIAEAGVNHNGDLNLAKRLIDEAVSAKADAIKFQTFKADLLVTKKARKASYQEKNTAKFESQYQMLKKLELSYEAYKELFEYCSQRDIIFLSTPFERQSCDFLYKLGVSAIKVSSGDLTDIPFLHYIALKSLPIILSTGMGTLGEVEAAVQTIRHAANPDLVLLHCVSNYPTAPAEVNLRAMETLSRAFSTPVGFSDHTEGIAIPIAAAALGASVIEKHFTLDKKLPGPDHKASIEPDELKMLVNSIRNVEKALGSGRKVPAASEKETAIAARKSLVAMDDLRAGIKLTAVNIAIKRPGSGLPPMMLPYIIGRVLKHDIKKDELFTLEMLR